MNVRLFLVGLTALALVGAPARAQMDHSMHTATPDTAPLSRLSGKAFDRAYLSMMVAHHQGALAMTRAVQARLTDPQVKSWAAAILREQTREIDSMNAWLRTLGGADTNAQRLMAGSMQGMTARLSAAGNADQAFVTQMLPHHASAVDMANLALQKSSDARVLKLSRSIIRAQADEMYAFRLWRAPRR
ncbi:DUF305 domain-containing protein [Deinococcus maricopensis]|uniref:DUF305 domain-containing protein n=1 Tax=Deinococcus maricopensis (strain DSM 21211 / LMG 22137 / NRRL B-23946 / LB-34) TaxID=709986 RepID=E8U4D5_DEIML|nr:DUF305 domain-containing protein [Deinococcus maricopensis]ADV65972.1 protein of unknown function DUF305 [Deinococcus maricopensis DSM 21211]